MNLGFCQTSGEPKSFVMAGYLGSLNSFHSFRENKAALRAHPLVMLMLLLRPPKKCLPCGKTVISEVHNWDPDTARDTEKKSETERRGGWGGCFGKLMMGGRTEKEKRSGARRPEAGKVAVHANGKLHHRGLRGKRRRKRRKVEEKLMGGRK